MATVVNASPPGVCSVASFVGAEESPTEPVRTVADWGSVIDELRHIRTLADGWDGEDAVAPGAATADAALDLTSRLQAVPLELPDRVTAGRDGTIFFVWVTPAGYCEFEVVGPNQTEWRYVHRAGSSVPSGTLALTAFASARILLVPPALSPPA